MRENPIATRNLTVSIIIPTYCEEESIEWCLKSIQGQEFEKDRIETIVVDSNSPDNTRAIATKYAKKVINIKTRGVGKARNVGAQEAKGDILLFLDADTVLDPEFLINLAESFDDNEVVCVSGAVADDAFADPAHLAAKRDVIYAEKPKNHRNKTLPSQRITEDFKVFRVEDRLRK